MLPIAKFNATFSFDKLMHTMNAMQSSGSCRTRLEMNLFLLLNNEVSVGVTKTRKDHLIHFGLEVVDFEGC